MSKTTSEDTKTDVTGTIKTRMSSCTSDIHVLFFRGVRGPTHIQNCVRTLLLSLRNQHCHHFSFTRLRPLSHIFCWLHRSIVQFWRQGGGRDRMGYVCSLHSLKTNDLWFLVSMWSTRGIYTKSLSRHVQHLAAIRLCACPPKYCSLQSRAVRALNLTEKTFSISLLKIPTMQMFTFGSLFKLNKHTCKWYHFLSVIVFNVKMSTTWLNVKFWRWRQNNDCASIHLTIPSV